MGEFGTGLRDWLERPRVPEEPGAAVAAAGPDDVLWLERKRLEALAAELAGREFELSQREAELEAAAERLALGIARALVAAASEAGVPPPLDEVTVARAKRGRVA